MKELSSRMLHYIVQTCRLFGGTYCFHLQGRGITESQPSIDALRPCKSRQYLLPISFRQTYTRLSGVTSLIDFRVHRSPFLRHMSQIHTLEGDEFEDLAVLTLESKVFRFWRRGGRLYSSYLMPILNVILPSMFRSSNRLILSGFAANILFAFYNGSCLHINNK
jgi:hypothetical protein